MSISPSAPIEISGSGKQATEFVPLRAGLAILKYRFEAAGEEDEHFSAELLTSDGDGVSMFANEIGKHLEGSEAVKIQEDGDFLMNVGGNGRWQIWIQQPR